MSDTFDHEGDAWDSLNDDRYQGEYENWGSRTRPRMVWCNHCRAGCTWHHTGERWALMGGDGKLHVCPTKANADDFDDLDDVDYA